jgi:hypothetical protein
MLIDSDDFTSVDSQTRAIALLTNPRINELARSGQAFRPVETDGSDHAADVFTCTMPDGQQYLAVFNFDAQKGVNRTMPAEKIGLLVNNTYKLMDLWTGEETQHKGILSVDLAPSQSKVFSVVPH